MRGHPLAEIYRLHLGGKLLTISFMTVAELFEGGYWAGWGANRWSALDAVLKSYVVVPWTTRRVCATRQPATQPQS